MRHAKLNKRFGRNKSARQALVKDLARATLYYESITTTPRKAKEARKLVEKLISWGKEGSLSSRRLAYQELCDHNLVKLLFADIAVRFKTRNGGYTRIYLIHNRRGDGSAQAILELTEKREKPKKIKVEKKEKKQAVSEQKEVKEEEIPQEKALPKEAPIEKKAPAKEIHKPKEEVESKEKVRSEEKSAPPIKDKQKQKEIKPPKKFFGGLRKLFKKERDSL